VAVSTAISQVTINDMINDGFLEIKKTGSAHSVEYSQTVSVSHDELFLQDDLTENWIAHSAEKFPAILATYRGREGIRDAGQSKACDLIYDVVAILENATHSEIAAFEEDIEYAIHWLRENRVKKTSAYFIANHRIVSSNVGDTSHDDYDVSQVTKIQTDGKQRYRVIMMNIVVSCRFAPKQLRS